MDLLLGADRSPDGEWVVFRVTARDAPPGAAQRFSRVPVSGGAPELLFEIPAPPGMFYCTDRGANFCACPARADDGRSWMIVAFDPAGGEKGKELLRIPVEPAGDHSWGLAPVAS